MTPPILKSLLQICFKIWQVIGRGNGSLACRSNNGLEISSNHPESTYIGPKQIKLSGLASYFDFLSSERRWRFPGEGCVMRTLLLFTLLFSCSANAQIYKCADETGVTQFSDRPCENEAEEITVAPPALIGTDTVRQAESRIRDVKSRWDNFSSENLRQQKALQNKLRQNLTPSERERIGEELQQLHDEYFAEMKKSGQDLGSANREKAIAEIWTAPR